MDWIQIGVKILLSIIFLYVVWTSDIDIRKTLLNPFSSILKFKKHHTVDISTRQTSPVRLLSSSRGKAHSNIALLLYDLKIVNTIEENITIKELALRYTLNGKTALAEHIALPTASLEAAPGVPAIIIRYPARNANLIGMDWKNLRVEIGNYKILQPGGVLAGSACFVFGFEDPNDLAKITNLELVVIDFSGNETTQTIPIGAEWIEMASNQIVERRRFKVDAAGKVQPLD
jgi:hypothetical protein